MNGQGDPGIFLCYRRDDTQGYAGWLWESLTEQFGRGRVFRDIDEIEPGLNFVEVIDEAMSKCRACLVLVGPRWLTVTDSQGTPRIQLEGDFVRLEVEAALSQDMRVIPVLLQGAEMPTQSVLPDTLKPLALRNAVELSESRWHYDVDRLVKVLTILLEDQHTAGELDLGKEVDASEEQVTVSGNDIGPVLLTEGPPSQVPIHADLIGDFPNDPREIPVPPNPIHVAVTDLPVGALIDQSVPVLGAALEETGGSGATVVEAPKIDALLESNGGSPERAQEASPTSVVVEAPLPVAVPDSTPNTARDQATISTESPSPARRRAKLIAVIVAGLLVLGVGTALALRSNGTPGPTEGGVASATIPVEASQTPTPSPPASPTPTTPTAAPSAPKIRPPAHLEATSVGQSVVELRWERPGGEVRAIRFLIIRNGQQIGKTTNSSFADSGLSAGTLYHYRILAVARDSQTSSKVLNVTTDAPPPPPPPPTPYEQCMAIGGIWLGQECLPP